jgi:hypothetical protein
MRIRIFPCKIEDVPVIGEFVVNSVERDLNDFSGYSSLFTIDYLVSIKIKIGVCKELVKSSVIAKELKFATQKLYDKSNNLRVKLNTLEGYLKLSADDLDVAVNDVNIKSVRQNISRGNIEGVLSSMKTALVAVKRNMPALEAKGLKQSLIDEIETQLQEINSLNDKQNELISKRNRLTSENIDKFNDLWSSLKPIFDTAKAIYRGVDDVKLKDYTIAHLKKRTSVKS